MPGRILTRPSAVGTRSALALGALFLTTAFAAPADSGALRASEWALTTFHAEQAWKTTKGAGVTVAVIGSGVEAAHPDLRGRVATGADFGNGASVDGTRDQGREGEQGTHAAGIIAGTARNFGGDGLYGLAPQARLLPLGVYKDGKPLAAATAKAIRYAADHGARVINVSVSFPTPSDALRSAVDYATDKDAVVVAAAGDSGRSGNGAAYPAALPGVVAVSATDKSGAVWPDSHHGAAVDLAAPGVGILTTAREGDYWTGDGTAYAAPWVAAGAALLRSEHPRWTADQVVQKLIDTADDKGAKGQDARYGHGIVAPAKALADRSTPSASVSPAPTGEAADEQDGVAVQAGKALEGGALLTIGIVAVVLIVAAIAAVVLINHRKPPPGTD